VGLEFEHRSSPSRYIERVWTCRSDHVAQMTSVATPRWGLVIWTANGRTYVGFTGPESGTGHAPVPQHADFFGIEFALGTGMPHLPVNRFVDNGIGIPDATEHSFRLAGSRWQHPNYDTAEAFVARLVAEDIIVCDPVVVAAEHEAKIEMSWRSVQRRFVAATGLAPGAAYRIDRARAAAVMIIDGIPVGDVITELGYFDHPHLARSLQRYVGRTVSGLRNLGRLADEEPLALAYKS
jgi:AraC-like DNA-binding protein